MNETNIDRHKNSKLLMFISYTLPLMWEMFFTSVLEEAVSGVQILPLHQNLYHSLHWKTQRFTKKIPCKSNTWDLASYFFFLNKFLLSLALITSNLYVCSFSVSSLSCCSHRTFPEIAFLCTIPQLGQMLLMNLTFFFSFYFTFSGK